MPENYYVYIDESGTPDLHTEKEGVLPYLVYSAFVIREKDIVSARNTLESIHTKYFPQNKYLKSQHIPNDHNGYVKTINILTELNGFEHYVYAIVINKSRIALSLLFRQSHLESFDASFIILDKSSFVICFLSILSFTLGFFISWVSK